MTKTGFWKDSKLSQRGQFTFVNPADPAITNEHPLQEDDHFLGTKVKIQPVDIVQRAEGKSGRGEEG